MKAKKAKEEAEKIWLTLKEKGLKKEDILLLKLTDVGFPVDFMNSVISYSYRRCTNFKEINNIEDLLSIDVKDLSRHASFFGPRHVKLLNNFRTFFSL